MRGGQFRAQHLPQGPLPSRRAPSSPPISTLQVPHLFPYPFGLSVPGQGVTPRHRQDRTSRLHTPGPGTSPSARNSSGASPPSSATLLLGEKDLFSPAMVIHRERKENKGEEPALRNALEAGSGTEVGAQGGGAERLVPQVGARSEDQGACAGGGPTLPTRPTPGREMRSGGGG
uniref:Uncharacterized protein n=1 Tax=Rangifer tarandus platyrhynchus TaxID=3082113 RepID=A0ACB0ECY1_RANTA|nr:unnamed protein product [Rangifer tarandus platyrhynchus]